MKKLILILSIILATNQLFSQCDPDPQVCEEGKGISTNPISPINCEYPPFENTFDWRMNNPANSYEYYLIYGSPNNRSVMNPFTGPTDALHYYPAEIAKHDYSNYQPTDGWELLKVEFGAPSGSPAPLSDGYFPTLPYMILYNKYSGVMRFFGAYVGQMTTYTTIQVKLTVPNPLVNTNYQTDLKATNLLSIQGESVQPLDQVTDVTSHYVYIRANNNPNTFFWFDLPVAYDPCICNHKSQLDIDFLWIKKADVEITGSISGEIKTQNEGQPGEYAQMVFSRLLAAGISGAVTIKTGGAVINVKAFTDLVDIAIHHPSRTNDEKTKLTSLKGYLNCAEKMATAVKGNFSDVTDTTLKKAYAAGQKILDANTIFLSSLAKGCNDKDNGATLITGDVVATGTVTTTVPIDDDKIELALPGSNWDDIELKRTQYTHSNSKFVPAYPTYNERLGTFALLETPKIKMWEVNPFGTTTNMYRIELLEESFKYTFNPKLNVDIEKTEIYCRYVVKDTRGIKIKDSPLNYKGIDYKNHNLVHLEKVHYPISSPFVPIDQIADMPFIFLTDETTPNPFISNDSVFIQFKILMTSNDLTSNGNAESYYVFTFPLSVGRDVVSYPEYPNPYTQQLHNIWVNQMALVDLFIINKFKSNKPNVVFSGIHYDNNTSFADDEVLVYDGFVIISANMSTAPGKKVKIYSTMGFKIEPGADIGPHIELIIGYPFEKIPQPPQTYTQVATFCADNNKYKAQEFSSAALRREKEEYDRRAKQIEEEIKKELAKTFINCAIHPNPNTGSFSVDFDRDLKVNAELSITDITGRSVHHEQLYANNSKFSINTNHLTPGVYFVSIIQGGEKRTTKIVIQ